MNKNEEVDFRKFQSKIDEVVQLLGSMNNSSSTDSKDEEDLSQIKEYLEFLKLQLESILIKFVFVGICPKMNSL